METQSSSNLYTNLYNFAEQLFISQEVDYKPSTICNLLDFFFKKENINLPKSSNTKFTEERVLEQIENKLVCWRQRKVDIIAKQSKIEDLKEHLWYPYFSHLREYVVFYVQNEDELNYLSQIIIALNRSVIVLCNFNLQKDFFPDWIQVVELDYIDQKVYDNSFLDNSFDELSNYINTLSIFLDIIQPAGIVMFENASFQKKELQDLGNNKQIPIILLQSENKNNLLQRICKTINEHFPFSYFNQVEKTALHIGCGNHPISGWLNTDLSFSEKIVFMNAEKQFPFPDSSFHYVFSEHLFEHLDYKGGRNMLHESYRVLKPKGIFRLTMPCLEFLMDLYLNKGNELNEKYIDWSISLFDPVIKNDFKTERIPRMFIVNNFMRFWGHKMIYDKETITYLLKKTGFKNVTYPQLGDSKHNILKNIEQHGKSIPEWANNLESFVVEAQK